MEGMELSEIRRLFGWQEYRDLDGVELESYWAVRYQGTVAIEKSSLCERNTIMKIMHGVSTLWALPVSTVLST